MEVIILAIFSFFSIFSKFIDSRFWPFLVFFNGPTHYGITSTLKWIFL